VEPIKFYFDIRDIFLTPRLALSGKKIWFFLKANLLGFAVYCVFTYLALLINGFGLLGSVKRFGLYPCIYGIDNPTVFSLLIFWIGVIFWISAIFFACTGVSRITYKQLKGDDLYSIADAQNFVKEHRTPIIMSSVSILIIAIFFIIGAIIFALIGKIPILGELLFALLYIIYFFGAVFTIYTLIVFIVSLIYSPAIIATMEEDTMGTVFQNYSITWSQPWRMIAYHIILLPIFVIGVYALKWFWFTAYKFINIIFGSEWLIGEKLRNIVAWATDLVNPNITMCTGLRSTAELGSNINMNSLLSLQNGTYLTTTEYISGTILAIIFFILIMSILSYGLSILSVGETIIFTILKKRSDDENLFERDDKDSLLENNNLENTAKTEE